MGRMKIRAMTARRSATIIALVSLLTRSSCPPRPGVEFLSAWQACAQLNLADLEKIVPQSAFRSGNRMKTRPSPTRASTCRTFATVYGDGWREIDEVLFTCADGYQPVLPVERFQRHAGYLVYRRLDQAAFTSKTAFRLKKTFRWGPSTSSGQSQFAGTTRRWRQWLALSGRERRSRDLRRPFPRLSPPKDASETVRQGSSPFGRLHGLPLDQRGRRQQGARLDYPVTSPNIFPTTGSADG